MLMCLQVSDRALVCILKRNSSGAGLLVSKMLNVLCLSLLSAPVKLYDGLAP